MRERASERITGDCINAVFQGFFDGSVLTEEHLLEGLGVALDDEFNFMLSHWNSSMLNGESFLKTSSGFVIYGAFEHNLPVGLVAIHRQNLKIFLSRSSLKRGGVEWSKDVAVFDTKNNIFYLVQLAKKDDQETTLDPKTSNSQSSRYDRVKLQWKIKIVERCTLKQDGSLAVNSKLVRRYDKKMDYFKADYTVRQKNQVNLLASTLGSAFHDGSFVAARLFLKKMANSNAKICIQHWKQRNQEEEILLLNLAGGKANQKKVGLAFSLTYDYIKSLGSYNKQGKLHGLGVQYRKNGQSFVGVFKQNLLAKEYKHNQMGSKNVSTFTTRQLAIQEHLKSLNFIHNTIYLPEINSITGIASKIAKYIQAFEREYEKRNSNYNQTPSLQSISSETMNIYKYVDFNRLPHEEVLSSRSQVSAQNGENIKKPGFILNKSNKKSMDRSNQRKIHSPSQKSPLRNVRITGKIYHQAQRAPIERSPSRQFAHLKLNEQLYRNVGNY